MNTLFTSRLNGVFILNTLLELHTPVTVSELTGIINRRYDHGLCETFSVKVL